MILLCDIGNTNTHVGLANRNRVLRQAQIPTRDWAGPKSARRLAQFVGKRVLSGAALCSVVPRVTRSVTRLIKQRWQLTTLELTATSVRGVGIKYPRPSTIGADRLANAIAARYHCGTPVVAVDFGTAVTFDVVNARGNYIGGIIAPGLAALTDYLHERTAQLPSIELRDVRGAIGKSTVQAMRIGAIHGYRGLIRGLLSELKEELGCKRLPVVATGGYARLMARQLPEIELVEPRLTLEGLRLTWMQTHQD